MIVKPLANTVLKASIWLYATCGFSPIPAANFDTQSLRSTVTIRLCAYLLIPGRALVGVQRT
jgi:hypothetical protein